MTFYVKDSNLKSLKKLDKETKTPLLEEVEKEIKESIYSLIEEAKKYVDSATSEFNIASWKFEYDIYFDEGLGLVPIGEATGVRTSVVGIYELTLNKHDKTIEKLYDNIEKLQELINKWENHIRNNLFKKIERYESKIESDINDLGYKYVIRGRVIVSIPIVSEGLLAATHIARGLQNGRN